MSDIPHRTLQVDPDDADSMLAAACALVPAWQRADAVTAHVVQGGITNRLTRLDAPGLPSLLVRVYGPNTDQVIDRPAETALLARLGRAGFAPELWGTFANGRIEQWLDGFRALEPHELALPALQGPIARRLRELHGHPAGGPDRLWHTLRGWMDRALHLGGVDLAPYAQALDALQAQAQNMQTRTVLAHNDLLAGNVLLHTDTGQVRFIDFEYGAPAPAAFDIANHFCEYAGFDSDFVRRFPRRAAREAFVAAYLDGDGDVTEWTDRVDFFVLPDHLWWGTWAVIQSHVSPIDFDYLGYARLRLAGFDLHADGLP